MAEQAGGRSPMMQQRFDAELSRQRQMQEEVWGQVGIPPEQRELVRGCTRRSLIASLAVGGATASVAWWSARRRGWRPIAKWIGALGSAWVGFGFGVVFGSPMVCDADTRAAMAQVGRMVAGTEVANAPSPWRAAREAAAKNPNFLSASAYPYQAYQTSGAVPPQPPQQPAHYPPRQ